MKSLLPKEVERIRIVYEKGTSDVANRIKECRTYPLYRFVRDELKTRLLTGEESGHQERIRQSVQGDLSRQTYRSLVWIECLKEWNGPPIPIC